MHEDFVEEQVILRRQQLIHGRIEALRESRVQEATVDAFGELSCRSATAVEDRLERDAVRLNGQNSAIPSV